MATRDAFLVNWVKTAYSMEMGLVPLLEKQRTQVQGDPELGRALDLHLQKTRQHVELLRGRLQTMGESHAAIEPSNPISTIYGHPSGPESTQQTELIDYVTEAFESASYRALKALAIQLGDNETSRICDQILQDELAMTQALDRRLPGGNGTGPAAGRISAAQGESAAGQDHVRLARANFDALNAHDLDRAQRDMTPDFRGEAPGMPGGMDREQNRAYLQGYMTAFPDLHFDIERVIAAGEQVVMEWIGSGTHTGPMAAPNGMNIPPTGKACRVGGSTSFEFRGGKISHTRVLFDSGELLRQLGLLPGSATNKAGEPNRDVVHIELPAADPKAAAEFYHKMFGWDYEHIGEPMNYTTFKTGNLGGGFGTVSEVYQPGGAILYVESKDIDADLRRAGSLGARTVVPKTEIPGMGWYAIFADPTGNHFGLFSS